MTRSVPRGSLCTSKRKLNKKILLFIFILFYLFIFFFSFKRGPWAW